MNKDLKQGSSVKSEISPADGKPMLPAVLKLTVKKEWFDLIKSGEKTEEYREVKNHWINRLTYNWNDHLFARELVFQEYLFVEVKNGYAKDAPTIIVECKNISIGKPKKQGSQLFTAEVFIISLGAVVWTNCG